MPVRCERGLERRPSAALLAAGFPLVEKSEMDKHFVILQRRRSPFGKSEDSRLVDSELRASVLVGWVRRTSDRNRDIPACVHQV